MNGFYFEPIQKDVSKRITLNCKYTNPRIICESEWGKHIEFDEEITATEEELK